jgi:phage N-6-adenine-methyltransferase
MTLAYMPASKTDDWATPQYLFDEWNAKYDFELDAAASSENHKCANWYGLDHPDTDRRDGLAQAWTGKTWVNPPYGKVLNQWVGHAAEQLTPVVMLLPARTDTRWFHSYCINRRITFIKGRVKFGGNANAAPFPSMIVEFNGITAS